MVVDAAREHAVAAHDDTLRAVQSAADDAALGLSLPASRATVAAALADALAPPTRTDLIAMLRGAVAAADRELQAEPVPASPYLLITARGPLVRATLADGRLVVLVRSFRRTDEGYVRADVAPEEAVEVRFRRRP